MDNKTSKASFGTMFAVAAVWFGSHVGGGFATGNQTVQYFVRFGWPTVFMPVLVIGLLGWCYYNGTVMAKNHQIFRYDDFARELYAPFSSAGKIFFDIAFFVLVTVAAGIAIAGGGSLFEELFKLNYYVGITITGLVFFLLTIFGADVVRKASSYITIFILIFLIILLVPGLSSGSKNIAHLVSTRYMEGTWGQVLWMGLIYGGFQILVVASIVSTSQNLKTTRDCVGFALIGFILNAVMTALCAIMILGYMPDIASNKLPILTIAKNQNNPFLLYSYSIVLYCAFVSTGVGVVFGLVARFENAILTNMDIGKRRALISFSCLLISVIFYLVGLKKLVAVGYGWIGRVCIFLLVIPLAIIAPIKNAKFKKEHPEIE